MLSPMLSCDLYNTIYEAEEQMDNSRTNKQIKLWDGRSLGYSEYGNPDGKPVFTSMVSRAHDLIGLTSMMPSMVMILMLE